MCLYILSVLMKVNKLFALKPLSYTPETFVCYKKLTSWVEIFHARHVKLDFFFFQVNFE